MPRRKFRLAGRRRAQGGRLDGVRPPRPNGRTGPFWAGVRSQIEPSTPASDRRCIGRFQSKWLAEYILVTGHIGHNVEMSRYPITT
jgi:hypothetical protein